MVSILSLLFIKILLLVNKAATSKTFKFASDNKLPLYFVSAADGTNVVKVWLLFISFTYLNWQDIQWGN